MGFGEAVNNMDEAIFEQMAVDGNDAETTAVLTPPGGSESTVTAVLFEERIADFYDETGGGHTYERSASFFVSEVGDLEIDTKAVTDGRTYYVKEITGRDFSVVTARLVRSAETEKLAAERVKRQ